MAEGAPPSATKELIALAISITRECDGCIVAHARGAAQRGVPRQEVAEAIGVAINLNGGPGTVWGPWALAAYDEYAQSPAKGPDPAPERAPGVQAAGAGVNLQSRCLMPLMNGESNLSGSPTASMSGRRSNNWRNITEIS